MKTVLKFKVYVTYEKGVGGFQKEEHRMEAFAIEEAKALAKKLIASNTSFLEILVVEKRASVFPKLSYDVEYFSTPHEDRFEGEDDYDDE